MRKNERTDVLRGCMSVVLFYVPELRSASAPADVPEYVAFFPCGLPEKSGRAALPGAAEGSPGRAPSSVCVPGNTGAGRVLRSPEAEAARREALSALPLSPPEARDALEELLRMGLEYSPGGLLRTAALYGDYAAQDARDACERADLERFAASGELPHTGGGTSAACASGDGTPARSARLIEAQKILILADFLEEKNLERAALEKKVHRAEQALRATLGEDGEHGIDAADAGPGNTDATGKDFPRVAPRTLLRAVRHFLPEHAALFTANDELTAELMEEGLLGPLPADRAILAAPWPEPARSRLLYARLPALGPADAAEPVLMRETGLLALPGPGLRMRKD
jgi:hypothetical protein